MADTSTGMAPINPELWDPVPVTLPTYVSKPPAARRTVRTISIDDSGVWSSGRTDADAQIAREADAADKAARKARDRRRPRCRLVTMGRPPSLGSGGVELAYSRTYPVDVARAFDTILPTPLPALFCSAVRRAPGDPRGP